MFMFKIHKNLYLYLRVMEAQKVIKLTPSERQIFSLLKSYRNELKLKTVLRVAGGWVRDKIMGLQSHDIDIALDDMKGQEFVVMIKELADKNHEKISGFGVTKFNPQMSKHLQTATAKIHEHWIDFVNLRSQKYGQDSRIPIIDIGTPKEDAERRDFTINSMFYNLDTEQIEDWTGFGLSDLQQKILRTPLKPFETFKDDPLRIMRCIRFKSRFLFDIEPSIEEALHHPDIKEALLKKVSKERIGNQLAGILKANHALSGLHDILRYELWNIIFEIPKDSNLQNPQTIARIPQYSFSVTQRFLYSLQTNAWKTQNQLIQNQLNEAPKDKKSKKKIATTYAKDQLRVMMLLGSLTNVYYNYQVKVGKTKANLTQFMIKDQLKYSLKYSRFTMHLNEGVSRLAKINVDNMFELIRWLRFAQEKWQLMIHLLWSCLEIEKCETKVDLLKLREYILEKGLEKAFLKQSPIDGTYLTKKGIKGPVVGKILENATIWQIINPQKKGPQFIQEFQANPQFFKSENTYK